MLNKPGQIESTDNDGHVFPVSFQPTRLQGGIKKMTRTARPILGCIYQKMTPDKSHRSPAL